MACSFCRGNGHTYRTCSERSSRKVTAPAVIDQPLQSWQQPGALPSVTRTVDPEDGALDAALNERRRAHLVLAATADAALLGEVAEHCAFHHTPVVVHSDMRRVVETARRWKVETVLLDTRFLSERDYIFDLVTQLRCLPLAPAVILLRDAKESKGYLRRAVDCGVYDIVYASEGVSEIAKAINFARHSRTVERGDGFFKAIQLH